MGHSHCHEDPQQDLLRDAHPGTQGEASGAVAGFEQRGDRSWGWLQLGVHGDGPGTPTRDAEGTGGFTGTGLPPVFSPCCFW